MASRARNLSGLMGTSSTLDINDIANLGDLTGVDSYADSDALALAIVPIGTQAYQIDTGSFKIYRGASGWAQMDEFPTAPSWVFQGSVSGYTSGGYIFPANHSNIIQKFPFATDGNATDVGDLTQGRSWLAGQSSSENGYTTGGQTTPGSNVIDKFPFATDGNATDVGDLTQDRGNVAGQSSSENGYTTGGQTTPASNTIDKFPFAADGNATDVGDLTIGLFNSVGQSSSENGYSSGGRSPAFKTTTDKFSFASDGNATATNTLTRGVAAGAGQSSAESGYTSGGYTPVMNTIDKFPFASDANATDVGDLTVTKMAVTGQSSAENGYVTGGSDGNYPAVWYNVIEKFPFASDANASDVGDLLSTPYRAAGQQV